MFIRLIHIVFFIWTSSILSETVILRSGGIEKGKITDQNDKSVTITRENGKKIEIAKSKILKVVYKDVTEAEALKLKADLEAKEKEKADIKLKEDEEKRITEQKENEREAARLKAEAENLKNQNLVASDGAVKCGSRFGIFWRSAILPGWGQYCAGYNKSAFTFFASSSLLLYNSEIRIAKQLDSAESTYNNANLIYQSSGPFSDFRVIDALVAERASSKFVENSVWNEFLDSTKNQYQEKVIEHNVNRGLLGLVYSFNLFHAYWIERNQSTPTPSSKFSFFDSDRTNFYLIPTAQTRLNQALNLEVDFGANLTVQSVF